MTCEVTHLFFPQYIRPQKSIKPCMSTQDRTCIFYSRFLLLKSYRKMKNLHICNWFSFCNLLTVLFFLKEFILCLDPDNFMLEETFDTTSFYFINEATKVKWGVEFGEEVSFDSKHWKLSKSWILCGLRLKYPLIRISLFVVLIWKDEFQDMYEPLDNVAKYVCFCMCLCVYLSVCVFSGNGFHLVFKSGLWVSQSSINTVGH